MSPSKKAIGIAKQYAESLRRKNLPVKAVILFGSQARGDYGPGSDIDVLVVTERLDKKIREAIIDEAYEINLKEDVPVIPLAYDLNEFQSPLFRAESFCRNISREGINVL